MNSEVRLRARSAQILSRPGFEPAWKKSSEIPELRAGLAQKAPAIYTSHIYQINVFDDAIFSEVIMTS